MNNNISIMERDVEYAQTLCASISDVEKRSRAVANAIAVNAASQFFDSGFYDIDIDSGLYKISSVAEKYDLSDIYINDSYVDVRVYFNDDELSVPKSHFEKSILPSAYMFIKLSPDLSSGTVQGFLRPIEVDTQQETDGDYFYLSENTLLTFEEIETRFRFSSENDDIDESMIYDFIDNSLDEVREISFIKDLLSSKDLRIKLSKAMRAQSLLGSVNLPDKQVLSFIDNSSEYEELQPDTTEAENSDNDFDGFFEESGSEVHSSGDFIDTDEDADSSEVNEEELMSALDYSTEITPSGAEVIASLDEEENAAIDADGDNYTEDDYEENSEQINSLFTGEQEGIPVGKKNRAGGFLAFLILALAVGYSAWWWYTNLYNRPQEGNDTLTQEVLPDINDNTVEQNSQNRVAKQQDAMPIETVENTKPSASKEAPASVSIPAIEQNLDASVLVSNLKVYWEVPAGYVSNTSAQRYLVKLGKIVQLNLKTELLLLSKPPLVNKISVELKFNPDSGKFEVVGLKNSSGEKTVDEAILTTVKKALSMNISANSISFAKLQGNPVLVINL